MKRGPRSRAIRERDRLIASEMHRAGKSNAEIAKALGISKRHVRRIIKTPVPTPAPQVNTVGELDAAGRPKRRPGEEEAAWRVRWRRWQLEQLRAENMNVAIQLKSERRLKSAKQFREEQRYKDFMGGTLRD